MNEQIEILEKTDDNSAYTTVGNVTLVNLPSEPTIIYSGDINLEIITIPQEKLELYARDYEFCIANKSVVRCLAGTSLTLLLAIVTSNFKDVFYITGEQWKAIFIVALLISVFCVFLRIEAIARFASSIKWFPKELIPDFPAITIKTSKEFVGLCKSGKS